MMPLMTRLNSRTVRRDPPRNVYISLLRSDRRKVITQMFDILARMSHRFKRGFVFWPRITRITRMGARYLQYHRGYRIVARHPRNSRNPRNPRLKPSIPQKAESAGAAHPLNTTTEPDWSGMAREASEGQSFHRSDRRCLRSWAGIVRAFHC